jgi:outer membrane protein assembly factor BamA
MDVMIDSAPVLDRSANTVAYTITVTPGEQYRIHEVKAEGLEAAAQKDFDVNFRLKTGELYNPQYVAGFIKNNTALRSLAPYTGTWKAYADPNNHTVDLVITFFRRDGKTVIDVH